MNTTQSSPATEDTQSTFDRITTFKQKTSFEQAINSSWRLVEPEAVENLMAEIDISAEQNQKIHDLAYSLAQNLRDRKVDHGKVGVIQGLLQEFSLSSKEGIALMCLAEALLRVPDKSTRDLLIRDKINQGNWKEHIGQSNQIFVNAAAWGLMLTGKLMVVPERNTLSSTLTSLIARCGKPIIRSAVDVVMRMMGEQFVTGETIEHALNNAKKLEEKDFHYSYDMLGEAALTSAHAQQYFNDYSKAIHAIGHASSAENIYLRPGISIKLSALHPRYQRAQAERVHSELYDQLLKLALLAKDYNIGLNIDAEEADRLELSLELLERLCFEPDLAGWKGIGFVVQAYQKRCINVVDYIVDLAKRSQKRLMVRLVKGAYWDSEIKIAQVDGMAEYPVFTRKVHTDISYIVAAKKLLDAPDHVFPQFATHNAQTLATIYHLADPSKYYPGQYEFQCLHGMGEPLYEQVVGAIASNKLGVPCRIYAPVGNHETLLAYLVRRLLENGANTSFVNRIADKNLEIEDLIENPFDQVKRTSEQTGIIGAKHPSIPLPKDILQSDRVNSKGLDLSNDADLQQLNQTVTQLSEATWQSQPLIKTDQPLQFYDQQPRPIVNPAKVSDQVGVVYEAQPQHVDMVLDQASEAFKNWTDTSNTLRAEMLLQAADLVESRIEDLMLLLCREAGKTYSNGIAEVREGVDFIRYYAEQIQSIPNQNIKALGTVLCISPWNFPFAIFIGQIAAAFAAGNCVIAKPAEQTPLIASEAVKILYEAGIPEDVIQLVPGQGETVGAQLSKDDRIQAIMFTGSTEVAKILQKTLAKRLSPTGHPIPLIAETGGQNAMIVDSSALTEQVVLDVVNSAFDSAGQRCSALRILCVQEDSSETLINMLKGAMQQLKVGQPIYLDTDIGPVIDLEAQNNIQGHINSMKAKGYPVHQLMLNENTDQLEQGTYIPPTLIELPDLNDLKREIFGPVLHVITYKYGGLEQLLDKINQKGYGLTMGLHTRINETIHNTMAKAEVGNLYINRNIVGAVVGVQPFGGEGMSGTGPKAGGPLYMYRLMQHTTIPATPFAVVQDLTSAVNATNEAYTQYLDWVKQKFPQYKIDEYQTPVGLYELPGPTGELNQYSILAKDKILIHAEHEHEILQQLSAVFAVTSQIVYLANNQTIAKVVKQMPSNLAKFINKVDDLATADFDAMLHHGSEAELMSLQQQIANRDGAIIGITHLNDASDTIHLERLLIERAVSINTAAAGGNATLMTLAS